MRASRRRTSNLLMTELYALALSYYFLMVVVKSIFSTRTSSEYGVGESTFQFCQVQVQSSRAGFTAGINKSRFDNVRLGGSNESVLADKVKKSSPEDSESQ